MCYDSLLPTEEDIPTRWMLVTIVILTTVLVMGLLHLTLG